MLSAPLCYLSDLLVINPLNPVALITPSKTTINRIADTASPGLTPLLNRNNSVAPLFVSIVVKRIQRSHLREILH